MSKETTGHKTTPDHPGSSKAKSIILGAAGVAVAAGAVAAVKMMRSGGASNGLPTFRVEPADDAWKVSDGNGLRETFDTKKAALEAARRAAHDHEPSRLEIYAGDGSLQDSHSYGDF